MYIQQERDKGGWWWRDRDIYGRGHQQPEARGSGGTNNLHPNAIVKVRDLSVRYFEAMPMKTVAKESCSILNAWLWIEVVVVHDCSESIWLMPQVSDSHVGQDTGTFPC